VWNPYRNHISLNVIPVRNFIGPSVVKIIQHIYVLVKHHCQHEKAVIALCTDLRVGLLIIIIINAKIKVMLNTNVGGELYKSFTVNRTFVCDQAAATITNTVSDHRREPIDSSQLAGEW